MDPTYKTLPQQWAHIQLSLKEKLGIEVFEAWFARIEFEEIRVNTALFSAPTESVQRMMTTYYSGHVLEHVQKVFPEIAYIKVRRRSLGELYLLKNEVTPLRMAPQKTAPITMGLSDVLFEQIEMEDHPSFLLIQKVVSAYFGITMQQLHSPSRVQEFSRPRHIAIYLSDRMMKKSALEIGRHFNKNHSTVAHSINIIKYDVCEDPKFANTITKIEAMIYSKIK